MARNLIHKELPEANDKTTEALGRRGRYILKNPRTLENLESCVLECRADKRFIIKPPCLKGISMKRYIFLLLRFAWFALEIARDCVISLKAFFAFLQKEKCAY